MSPEFCRDCVAFSVNQTLNQCPNEVEVTFYNDECMLRYSSRRVLLDSSLESGFIMSNTQNVTSNQTGFKDLVLSTMSQAAIEASLSSLKFNSRKANLTALQTVYGLVQCTPDLTTQDCLSCLQQITNKLPIAKIGGRVVVPSCNSRYERYSVYNESAAVRLPLGQHNSASPPPPASFPSPRPGLESGRSIFSFSFDYMFQSNVSYETRFNISLYIGKGGNSSSVITIAVLVPITVLFLLFVAIYSVRDKKTRSIYETEPLTDAVEVVSTDRDDITTAGSLQFDFKTIEPATDKFSYSKKLGQGGFGAVYKV
ncbi:unnamed protein product [Microthlaspi erraticum]|uniref:Gnk2-homologous domain-containing protein n=1 Tax=Microthlaspi erraticum TaxID=1685480 RepID=A0A6D2JDI5_9BRAS|nr:unnamed protein product [Microthlaspi erraticum]